MTEIALAIVHDRIKDKVLLIQRAGSTDFHGWAFPGGKLEKHGTRGDRETAAEAARRELLEETGVCVHSDGRPMLTRVHPSTGVIVSYVYFPADPQCAAPRARNMEPAKAASCRWVKRSAVRGMFEPGFSSDILTCLDSEAHSEVGAQQAIEPESAAAG